MSFRSNSKKGGDVVLLYFRSNSKKGGPDYRLVLWPRPARLSWRSSLLKYFGVDPLIDSRGDEMHWVRRESVVVR